MHLPLPRSALVTATAVVLSGALLHVGTGLHAMWWVAMLAPLPVLWAAPRLGGRAAFGAAVLAWALGALNEWTYLRGLHLPLPVVVLETALIFGLATALFRAFLLRGAALRAAVSVPVVWLAWELVASWTSGHGTFGSLAYTQMDDLPVLQLASALGSCGVAFTVLFFPASAAAIAFVPRAARLPPRTCGPNAPEEAAGSSRTISTGPRSWPGAGRRWWWSPRSSPSWRAGAPARRTPPGRLWPTARARSWWSAWSGATAAGGAMRPACTGAASPSRRPI